MNSQHVTMWIGCGLLVGFLARLLSGGFLRMSLLFAMTLAATGGFVGGMAHAAIYGLAEEAFSWSSNAWQGWILAALGSLFALLAFETYQSSLQE